MTRVILAKLVKFSNLGGGGGSSQGFDMLVL